MNPFFYHFMKPDSDLKLGLQALENDKDVLMMLKYVPQFNVIDAYT